MRRRTFAAAAAAALAGAALAGTLTPAAPATTGTEIVLPMPTRLTDRGIVFNAPPRVELDTTFLFLVTNRSSRSRWFQVGTSKTMVRRTKLLRRGETARFYYVFQVRGRIPYRSDGPTAPLRSGIFRVA